MDRRSALLAIAAAALAGCYSVNVGKPTIDVAATQARAAQIDVKSMNRDQVHALMGTPWLASDVFGVELYRARGTQGKALVIVAVPVPDLRDTLEVLSLVTYDADGSVQAFASDSASGAPVAPPALVLRAGDFEFVVHGPRDYKLSVTLARYAAVRATTADAGGRCTVLLEADPARLPAAGEVAFCSSTLELTVDGTPPRGLRLLDPAFIPADRGVSRSACQALGGSFNWVGDPDRGSCVLTPRVSYPLSLPAGPHVLRFTAGRGAHVTRPLLCNAGAITHARLGGNFVQCYRPGSTRVDRGEGATVVESETIPATGRTLHVIINDGGQWLYPALQPEP